MEHEFQKTLSMCERKLGDGLNNNDFFYSFFVVGVVCP